MTARTIPGFVPHVTCGEISLASITTSRVELGALVGAQLAPLLDRLAELLAARRAGAAPVSVNQAKVVSSGAIMPARPPPSIVMLQTVIRPSIESASIAGPGVLDDVPGETADAEPPERAEDQVLGGHAEAELALVADPHRARLVLDHALRGEHVLDLGGADPEGERAEGAVRGGVGIAADDRHAGLRDAELGADHVHDPLAVGAERVDGHAELGAVALERFHLHARELVLDPRGDGRAVGRRVVVGGRERAVGPAHRPAGHAQAVEGLRAGDLVDEVQVDVEQPVRDLVGLPDLVEQRLWHRHRSLSFGGWILMDSRV